VPHTVARQLPLSHEATALDVSADGKRLAASSLAKRQTVLFELRTGLVLFKLGVGATAIAFSPDGTRLATAFSDERRGPAKPLATPEPPPDEPGRSVRLWDMRSGRCLTPAPWIGEAPIAFSPDGRLLAVAAHPAELGVLVLRAEDGTLVRALDMPEPGALRSLRWSPDGRWLAATTGDAPAVLWSSDRWERETPPGVRPSDAAVAFAQSEGLVAAASPDCRVRIFTLDHPDEPRVVLSVANGHQLLRGIEALVFSPEGSLVAAQGRSGATQIWSVQRARPLWTASPGPLAMLPGGKSIAAWWYGAVWLRDAETGDFVVSASEAEAQSDAAPDTRPEGPASRIVTLRSRDLEVRRAGATLPVTPVIIDAQEAPSSEARDAAVELLGRLSAAWAESGYRTAPLVAGRDADGLGVRLPLRAGLAYVQIRPRAAGLRILVTVTGDESDVDPPPSSGLVRLSRWIRERLSTEARRKAAVDREWAAELAPEGREGEVRIERALGSLTITLDRAAPLTLDDLASLVRTADRAFHEGLRPASRRAINGSAASASAGGAPPNSGNREQVSEPSAPISEGTKPPTHRSGGVIS
jgi:WD40 repeat protein